MYYRFQDGDKVRVIRNIRNDGTYPGKNRGDFLIERGSTGYVVDVGTFLLDQIIYSVHFLEQGMVVGCREEELIDADEPWKPSRFQFRDKVVALIPLAIQGSIVVEAGAIGEVYKVLHDETGNEFNYHVYFGERFLQVPEKALDFAPNMDSSPLNEEES
jgi:nitrogen fixation protein NifZ